MKNPERITARIGALVMALVGGYTLLTADLDHDKEAEYRVRGYRGSALVSDEVVDGKDLIRRKRIGGAICLVVFGGGFWYLRPKDGSSNGF